MNARIALATLALSASSVFAQDYPTKAVTVIVPWPAGGPSDIAARPVAKGLTDQMGKPFVIDNRGGASGNIGTQIVAKAQPADGYTVLITSSSPIVINPSLYKSLPFDPAKDLVPITNILRVPLVLAVNPSVPAKNLKEFMEYVKKQGGKMNYASSGSGTPQHLTSELFKTVAKLDMTHVPYKGSAPALTDVIAGHVPMMFDSTIAIVPQLKAGKLRPLAVTGAKRSPELPDVPTFAEQGVNLESYAWYGMFARAGTPKPIVDKLNAEARKAMATPEFKNVLKETGSEDVGDTPENFNKFVQAEATKWAKVVKDSGATAD